MAIQGDLVQPYPDLVSLDLVAGVSLGDLVEPYVLTLATDFTIDSIKSGRFPTPSAALGFLTQVLTDDGEFPYQIPPYGLSPPYFIVGSLYPESDFLEPTKGQIWPRIG